VRFKEGSVDSESDVTLCRLSLQLQRMLVLLNFLQFRKLDRPIRTMLKPQGYEVMFIDAFPILIDSQVSV